MCNSEIAICVSHAPTGLGVFQLIHPFWIGVEAEQVNLEVSYAGVENILDFLCVVAGLGSAQAPHNLSGLFILTIVGVKGIRSRALVAVNRPNTCGGLIKVVAVNTFVTVDAFIITIVIVVR